MQITNQQLADALREAGTFNQEGMMLLLNGDSLKLNLSALVRVVDRAAAHTEIGRHRQNLLTQSAQWGRERDMLVAELAEARTLIGTLREQNQRLIEAAQAGASALRACTDAATNPQSYPGWALAELNKAAPDAGVVL